MSLVTKINDSNKFKTIIVQNFMFYFFKLTGIATININSSWIDEAESLKCSFVSSKISVFYNVFLIISLIIMYFFTYEYSIKTGYGGRFDKDKAVVAAFDSSIILITALILGTYCVKREKVTTIANKMSKIKYLKNINIKTKNDYFGWLFLGNILLFINPATSTTMSLKTSDIVYAISFRSSLFIIDSLLIQYTMVAITIQNFFEFINKNLLELSDRHFRSTRIRPINNCNLKNELDNLITLYLAISKVSQEISDLFSFPILWSLIAIFVDLLMCLYHLIKILIISNNLFAAFNSHDMTHVFFHFIFLIFFTECITDAIEEVIIKKFLFLCLKLGTVKC